MNFSGIIEMDEIPAIQELLKDAKSFCCYQEALANSEWVNWTAGCVLAHCAPSSGVMTHTEWSDVYPGMIVE